MKSNIKKDLKQGIPTIEIKNSGQAPNPFFQAAIRAALLCLAAFGTCLIFATTYRIPVDEYQLALFCTLCTAGLFVFFIFLKLRFAIPVLAVLCSAFLDKDKLLLYVGHFYNFFTYRLDSRLLYTSQFATLKQSQIRADYVIAGAFCLFLIVCFIYALSSRVKFIGTILITSILLLIPAFISETAVFSFGYYLLFSAMAGLYCIWVSHESTLISKPKAVKSGVMRQIIGGIPYAGNHGVQGLLTSLICVAAVFAGESLATGENSKASRFIYQIQQELVNAAANLPSLLDLGKGLQDNGYFSFGNSGEISNFIHLNAPPTGNRPVLSVKRQSNTDPLYLRGGISLDYNSAARGWTTNSKTEDISELNQLIKGYYPEMEYMFFAQRMRACFEGDT
ncbi:MAG: hypothetical protein LBR74_04060 [Eubacterium sp.]|jgi:hypothetical protein|nr:hypothetical protein [Eubacterium sp.]